MNAKTLKRTNPYLKDASTRSRLIKKSVRSSSGVEGIKIDTRSTKKIHIPSRGKKKIYK